MTSAATYGSFPIPRGESRAKRGILTGLVAGYVALLPYQFEAAKGINFAAADIFLLVIVLLAAAQIKYVKPAWTIWHLGILLTFVMGSLVASVRFGNLTRYELVNKDAGLLLPLLSYAAITSAVTGWDDLRFILRVFTAGVVLENLMAVAAYMAAYFFGVTTPFARYGGLRLSGMLLDPNAYGGLLVATLVMCEGGSWGPAPLFKRVPLLFCRLTLALGILFTFSRSAWTGLVVAMLFACLIRPKVVARPVITVLIAAPCLILVMGQRFLPIVQQMSRRPDQIRGRFDLIRQALEAFSQYPFLGGGLGSFRLGAGEVAHNSAMWFLADFGIVGLAAWLGFIGWFFAKAWFAYRAATLREKPLALALLLGHVSMFGVAMGIEAFYQRHWWVIFALIASSYSIALRTATRPDRETEGLAHARA